MTGTAAEVTPIRSVDDHEIGVRARSRSRSRRRTSTPCAAAASAGRSGSSTSPAGAAPRARREHRPPARSRSRAPYIDEREEELVLEVLRSGRLSLGPAIERGSRSSSPSASARRTPPPSRAGRRACTCCCAARGRRARRRGDHVAVLVRRHRRTASSTRARRRSSPTSTRDAQPRPGRGRGGDHARGRSAIVAVDMFGYPCELDPLRAICDAARAGADRGLVRGARRRVQGRAARLARAIRRCSRFYPNKQMTTGEGGIVTTQRRGGVARCSSVLRNQGRADGGGWFDHVRLGFNYRFDDVSAALGIAQLEKLDRILALRREAARSLRRALGGRRRASSRRSRRRGAPAVVVRLRREARARRRPRRRDRRARGARASRARQYVPCDPPAAVHARAVRLRGGHVPGRRGRRARTLALAVLHRDRGRGPGARGRGAAAPRSQR